MDARERVERGEHACLLYTSPEEQLKVAAAYIAEGLSAGERCVYIYGDQPLSVVAAALEESGIDVGEQVAVGALQLSRSRDTYLRGGTFDSPSMIVMLEAKVTEALAAGYSGLRGTGEMEWALSGAPGCEQLLEYERTLGTTVFKTKKMTGLCQYDGTRFSPEVLREIIDVHPVVIVAPAPPETVPA